MDKRQEEAAPQGKESEGRTAEEAAAGAILETADESARETAPEETEEEPPGILRAAKPNMDGVTGPGAENGGEAVSPASPSSAEYSPAAASASQAVRVRDRGRPGHVDFAI